VAGLPLSAKAVFALLKELRAGSEDERPLVVGGARELRQTLIKELGRGGELSAVREGVPVEDAAALVYLVARTVTQAVEEELHAADRAGVPVVCVLLDPAAEGRVPYVLATNVVRARRGAGFPVEEIAAALARTLGESATGLAARLPVLREAVVRELIDRISRQNGILGVAIFLPGADLPALTLNQLRLVLRIGAAHGQKVDRDRLPEILGVVGAGLGFRALARQLLGIVPIAGWAVKGAVAYFGTRALGKASARYFATSAGDKR
jgi:uncharacterized protein (DUF697 family)